MEYGTEGNICSYFFAVYLPSDGRRENLCCIGFLRDGIYNLHFAYFTDINESSKCTVARSSDTHAAAAAGKFVFYFLLQVSSRISANSVESIYERSFNIVQMGVKECGEQ